MLEKDAMGEEPLCRVVLMLEMYGESIKRGIRGGGSLWEGKKSELVILIPPTQGAV